MVETIEFLQHRRSVLARNMTAPGPDAAQLRALLGIAARVPDHGKLAPWRFVVLAGDD
ncbi:MAG: nitroreductase family protein, partial [Alphaproteobacteria bacterium]|nr:nitroreductase family protein [Alphaproteobacteria bacterium]